MLKESKDVPKEGSVEGAATVERGEFSPRRESAPARLVVVTYNIRYAVGSHLISGGILRRMGLSRHGGRSRIVEANVRRAAAALSGGDSMPPADIIALQEADRETRRAGGHNVARELASTLAMNYVRTANPTPCDAKPKDRQWYLDFEEPLRVGEEGDTGVAILSRFPLDDASRIDLPWAECPWRPRLALRASFTLGDKLLRVYNAHIDPHAGISEQIEQHRAVLAHANAAPDEPTVLLGDFNTLSRASCIAARRFLEDEGYSTPLPTGTGTWRSGPLRLHADWIFVRNLRVLRWGVARPSGISDHWPVWAEIEMDEKGKP